MPETISPLNATAIQTIVAPLGIKLSKELPDFGQPEDGEISEAFASEVDRLLGTQHVEEKTGGLTDGHTTLTVGSEHRLIQVPSEPDDPYENYSGYAAYTRGPKRWLRLLVPLQLTGPGIRTELTTGLTLKTRENYDGHVTKGNMDSDTARVNMEVDVAKLPYVTTPAETAFGVKPAVTYRDIRGNKEERLANGQQIWRNYHDERLQLGFDSIGTFPDDERNRMFGVGIEILRAIDPRMLTLQQSS